MDGLSVFISLIIVIGIILLTYWFSKTFANQFSAIGNGKHLKVKERILVGRDKYVAVIQLDDQQYLIGIAEQNITLLEKLEHGIVDAEVQRNELDFSAKLKKVLQKKKGTKGGTVDE